MRSIWLGKNPKFPDAIRDFAGANLNVGEAYQQLGDLKKAFESYELARQGFKSFANLKGLISHQWNVAVTLEKLANVSLWMRDFEKAQDS